VSTSRATIITVDPPFADSDEAAHWLSQAGEDGLNEDLAVLNRALHAFRLVIADPYLHPVGRHQALVARLGYGVGEQVAEGRWTDARELATPERRQRRAKVLQPQVRLAALLSSREHALVCEELALRARLDLDHDRDREAALQVWVALDAAIAELSVDPSAQALADRLDELRELRDPVAAAAQAALEGILPDADRDEVQLALERIEAALRARAVARA
jgi:hypothetical protein